jgi:hypothetical protein
MIRVHTTKLKSRIILLRCFALISFTLAAVGAWTAARAQDAAPQPQAAPTGSVEFAASVAPTDGRPEPVRQFTFYLLRRSLADIHAQVEAADPPPQLDAFADSLSVSPELKAWMKKNQWVELAGTDFTKKLTPQTILGVPEFMKAYVAHNSGFPGAGFPSPKYRESDRLKNPDKYDRELKEFQAAVLHYAIANPSSKDGMDAELTQLDPSVKWFAMVTAQHDRAEKRTLDVAQTQYLAAQTDSDLNGQGSMSGIPAGDYWIGTLGAVAQAGDVRESWDVQITVRANQTTQIEITNLNATAPAPPAR